MQPVRTRLVLTSLLLVLPAAAADDAASEPPARTGPSTPLRTGWGFAGLPLVNFSSDVGLGYGLRGAAYDYGDGQVPYRYAIVATYFATTGGQQKHSLKLDAPRFLGTPWRFDVKLYYQQELFMPFYGVGNASSNEPQVPPLGFEQGLPCDREGVDQSKCDPDARFYTNDLIAPYLFFNARRDIEGTPWKLFGGYKFRLAKIVDHPERSPNTFVDTKLRLDKPLGWDCGRGGKSMCRTAWLDAGIVYDTRDLEPAPMSGMFHELSLRGASKWLGSSFNYGGVNLHLRAYLSLTSDKRLVFASRFLADVLFGDVPFYEQGYYGGLAPDEAIGGSESVRGQLRLRYIGNVKVMESVELRWMFLKLSPGTQKVDFTFQVSADAGRVWSKLPGDPALDGTGMGLHFGLGAGLRIAWNDNFIVRVDFAPELGSQDGGLYITFDHVF